MLLGITATPGAKSRPFEPTSARKCERSVLPVLSSLGAPTLESKSKAAVAEQPEGKMRSRHWQLQSPFPTAYKPELPCCV